MIIIMIITVIMGNSGQEGALGFPAPESPGYMYVYIYIYIHREIERDMFVFGSPLARTSTREES